MQPIFKLVLGPCFLLFGVLFDVRGITSSNAGTSFRHQFEATGFGHFVNQKTCPYPLGRDFLFLVGQRLYNYEQVKTVATGLPGCDILPLSIADNNVNRLF